ncbi:hypothetical protein B0H63DRAFT_507156 [Podospora didyma]|uniref:Uncharacterized protein n=1 Tax=Podospora didyma TaxID=330526 RepID=A0AAE0NXT6_9PEZI|nr:hypothetical protein B0H63DRAFT_507156 [Podospora didyma]
MTASTIEPVVDEKDSIELIDLSKPASLANSKAASETANQGVADKPPAARLNRPSGGVVALIIVSGFALNMSSGFLTAPVAALVGFGPFGTHVLAAGVGNLGTMTAGIAIVGALALGKKKKGDADGADDKAAADQGPNNEEVEEPEAARGSTGTTLLVDDVPKD